MTWRRLFFCWFAILALAGGSQARAGDKFDMAKMLAKSVKAPHRIEPWEGMESGQTATWEISGQKYTVGVVSLSPTVLEYSMIQTGENRVWIRIRLDEEGKTEKAWIYTVGGDKAYELNIRKPDPEPSDEEKKEAKSNWEIEEEKRTEETLTIGETEVKTIRWAYTMKNKKDGQTIKQEVWYAKDFPRHPTVSSFPLRDEGVASMVKSDQIQATAFGTDYEPTFPGDGAGGEEKDEDEEE